LEQRPGEGKQIALRRCFERSRGEILYFTDADCVVPASALERVVGMVASGQADAATGPADPLPEQRDDPWVRHQWATTRAVDRRRGPDAAGLLGRNFAARRAAVAAAGGFQEPVPIGTDYHLAKVLLQQGRTIRYVPAPVQTRYLEEVGPYLRQQSRWLRNIFVHGRRFGDREEVVTCARTVALGSGILLWPLSWPWSRRPGVAVWLLAIGWMARRRLLQERELEAEMALGPLKPKRAVWGAFAYSFLDLLAWSRPLIDALHPGRRLRW
jgi:cellulose synthase/poly-beta-1,6-N-acetylglucosamine synthase-like glycosyltransferase